MTDKLESIEQQLAEVELLIQQKHLPGQHDQSSHGKRAGAATGGGSKYKPPATVRGGKPARGRVDTPGYKYSSKSAANLALKSLGVAGAKGVEIDENYWQDAVHRITMYVPHRVASPAKMGKALKAAGYVVRKKYSDHVVYDDDKGNEISVDTEGGGTGGGQEWGYQVRAYIWDSRAGSGENPSIWPGAVKKGKKQ